MENQEEQKVTAEEIEKDLENSLLDIPEPGTFQSPDIKIKDDEDPKNQSVVNDTTSEVPEDVQNAYDAFKDIGVEFPEDFDLKEKSIDDIKELGKELLAPKKEEVEDPVMQEYLKAKKTGLSFDEFVQQKNQQMQFMNMPADDGLKSVYQNMKNENGERLYTDDVIEEHLGKLTQIEKDQQWNQVKQQVSASKGPEKEPEANDQFSEINKGFESTVEELSKEYEEIGGIPFGESDKKEFNQEFNNLLKLDAKSEPTQVYKNGVYEMMKDTKTLYELMYLHRKLKDGGLQKFINSEKEKAISEALEKAGIEPQRGKGGRDGEPLPPQTAEDFI